MAKHYVQFADILGFFDWLIRPTFDDCQGSAWLPHRLVERL